MLKVSIFCPKCGAKGSVAFELPEEIEGRSRYQVSLSQRSKEMVGTFLFDFPAATQIKMECKCFKRGWISEMEFMAEFSLKKKKKK